MSDAVTPTSWRLRPFAVLPLALLLSIGFNITELTVTYLLRAIYCEEYEKNHTPEHDACRNPNVVRAYTRDIAAYQTIYTVLSILSSGLYGKLVDTRGRRYSMLLSSLLTAVGSSWLTIAAYYESLRRPWLILLSAAIKGCGGGLPTMNTAHAAFVCDVSSPTSRSFHIGLLWIMYWIGAALSPLISAVFIERGLYAENCSLAVLNWAVYMAYAGLVIPETLPPSTGGDHSDSPEYATAEISHSNRHRSASGLIRRLKMLIQDVLSPVFLVCRHRILRWLVAAAFLMFIAVGVNGFIVPYCDHKFGLTPSAAGMISAVMNISRATAVLLVLPVFVAGYRHYITKTHASPPTPDATLEESTSLLPGLEPHPPSDPHSVESSAAQELVVSRLAFLMDAVGAFLTWKSRNAAEVAISMAIGAFGAPAGPSLQSLVTLAVPPGQVGRALAGKSMLESVASAVRGPIYYALYDATLEKSPGTIWLFTMTVYAACSALLLIPRSRHFV